MVTESKMEFSFLGKSNLQSVEKKEVTFAGNLYPATHLSSVNHLALNGTTGCILLKVKDQSNDRLKDKIT